MHRLQQHILHQLITNPTRRYADLKPADVEGNLFMYHLRCLMKEGIVEKRSDGLYQLTSKGKVFVDRLSLKSFTPRMQPRIVTLMAVRRPDGKLLMYRRRKQPLINMIGFPYGKIHLGETIKEAAEGELREKTGLSAQLKHIGDGYANTFENNEPISQIMFHLFIGNNPSGELRKDSSAGESIWLDESELDREDIMPNVIHILSHVNKYDGSFFFTELNHHLIQTRLV